MATSPIHLPPVSLAPEPPLSAAPDPPPPVRALPREGPVRISVPGSVTDRLYGEALALRRGAERMLRMVADLRDRSEPGTWAASEAALRAAAADLGRAAAALPEGRHLACEPVPGERVEVDELLVIAPESRRAWVGGRQVALTRLEFLVLAALARDPHRVWTKQELYRDVWGATALRTRTLESHASKARRALVRAGAPEGRYVVAVWGVGFRLLDGPRPPALAA
jgi:hypothetical protein